MMDEKGALMPGDAVKGVNITAIMDETNNIRPYYFRGGPVMPDHALAVGSTAAYLSSARVNGILSQSVMVGWVDIVQMSIYMECLATRRKDAAVGGDIKVNGPTARSLPHTLDHRGSWGILPNHSVHEISLLLRVDLDEPGKLVPVFFSCFLVPASLKPLRPT
eukprot:757529-Hanusia_phi.AAC.2